MDVLLIGYKNHALRLLKLIHELPSIGRIYVYHPSMDKLKTSDAEKISKKISLTNRFDGLPFQAAIIASPTSTHAGYLKKLSGGKYHIFCEKPPVSTPSELKFLEKLKPAVKERIYFNMNYRFTELGRIAKEYIRSGKLGKPVHFRFVSTQGMAFKESFGKNWRASKTDGILTTVGIHYVDLCQWLISSEASLGVSGACHSPHSGKNWDTCAIQMSFKGGPACHILNSYAAPFANTAELYFEDGILRFDNGIVSLFSPRDTFDASGRFTVPPHKILHQSLSSLEYYNASLSASLRHFFSVAEKDGKFDSADYSLALRSNALILKNRNK